MSISLSNISGSIIAETWWRWRNYIINLELDRKSFDTNSALELLRQESPDVDKALEVRFALLQTILRRFPYWSRGHLYLGRLAIDHENVALAYASAQAIFILARNKSHIAEANWILGRCYLKRREPQKALDAFKLIEHGSKYYLELKQDLVAALMALEKWSEARDILLSIPEEGRGPQLQAALKYVQGKIF